MGRRKTLLEKVLPRIRVQFVLELETLNIEARKDALAALDRAIYKVLLRYLKEG